MPKTKAASPTDPARVAGPSAVYFEIATAAIVEAVWNPRRRHDQAALDELADSIRAHGVLEPILVRPDERYGLTETYEIVAGSRRFRAAKAAGLTVVPCRVLELSDGEALEIALVENSQRADIHPLDEALGYQRLLDTDGAYTVEGIAQKVGKHVSTIRGRLRLLKLTPTVQAAYLAEAITAAHAERLTRLSAEQQAAALEACFNEFLFSDVLADRDDGPSSVEECVEAARFDLLAPVLQPIGRLDEWLREHAKADLSDPEVVQPLLEELGQDTDRNVDADDPIASLLQLSASDEYIPPSRVKALGVVAADKWKPVASHRDRCKHTRQGVVVHGGPLRLVEVCASPRCEQHWPKPKAGKGKGSSSTKSSGPSTWESEEQKRKAEAEAWKSEQPALFAALAIHVENLRVTADLVALAIEPYTLKAIQEEFGVKLTDKTVGQVLALSSVTTYSREQFASGAKALGFTMPRKPKAAPAPKAAAATKGTKAKKGRAA